MQALYVWRYDKRNRIEVSLNVIVYSAPPVLPLVSKWLDSQIIRRYPDAKKSHQAVTVVLPDRKGKLAAVISKSKV
jgi:hypothetical protein